ncbi:class I SAM-dependent methyltransferase [Candidatus Ichthyocystis hellenicum]|uniref:class I SAM-dependent methyltransferase n=1 Tax=Candidatus Ichthyocystis hellenicum TaxID=1561003 RepID=UPI000B8447BA|nr:methyltransferase domain-containing protein [Candidatus Ichthyocystis hellenicum]
MAQDTKNTINDEQLGRKALQEWEQSEIDKIVRDIFGDIALQIGTSHNTRLLQESRINNKITLDNTGNPSILAQFDSIPILSDSIDLVVLPHILESSSHPKFILQEVHRTLRPGGSIVLTVFNPWSFWGIHQVISGNNDLGIPLSRIKDWMNLFGLHIIRGSFGCYRPLTGNKVLHERLEFLERMGNRWWPLAGSVYIVCAIKEVAGMTLIMKNRWRNDRNPDRILTTVCRRKIKD